MTSRSNKSENDKFVVGFNSLSFRSWILWGLEHEGHKLCIWIPGALPKQPNDRMNWRVRAVNIKEEKERCTKSIDKGIGRHPNLPWLKHRVAVEYTYFYCGKGLRDWDNALASMKGYQDALVSTGLILDDSPHIMDYPIVTPRRVSKIANKGVLITITKSDKDFTT